MGEISARCIKWLMFGFNFVFLISGITLIAAGAVAQSMYRNYGKFFGDSEGLVVSAPVLLIIVGIFVSIIAFLGCCGAARENYAMLMAFSIIVGIIFVVQMAGGIAGYVQKGHISNASTTMLRDIYMPNYFNTSHPDYALLVDELQVELKCCGSYNYSDWFAITGGSTTLAPVVSTTTAPAATTVAPATTTAPLTTPAKPPVSSTSAVKALTADGGGVMMSCCALKDGKDKNLCTEKQLKENYVTVNCPLAAGGSTTTCPVYMQGCEAPMKKTIEAAMTGVAGAAIGLGFFQLIGIVFACYLSRRIRSGYVYA